MAKSRVLTKAAVIALLAVLTVAPLTASAAPSPTAAGPGCSSWYVVHRGDTLARIAAKFGTTVWAIAEANDIENVNRIFAGQKLCIPGPFHPPKPPPSKACWYKVRWGDTLTSIARRYGVSVWYLTSLNGLPNPDCIFAGQWLRVPCPKPCDYGCNPCSTCYSDP